MLREGGGVLREEGCLGSRGAYGRGVLMGVLREERRGAYGGGVLREEGCLWRRGGVLKEGEEGYLGKRGA